jgi:putative peptidoglycan lipid II flippase
MVNLITQKFGSEFGGEGVNTVLRAANTLMQAPLGFFGQALALAVFPVLAEYVAKERMDLYREQVSKTLRTVIYLGTMSGALMLALAPQISRLLYGWGKATDNPEALAGIADCLRIYSVAIFAWCMQPVLMRGFFSLHKTLKPVVIGTAMTGLFILMCVFATRTSTDYRTLPWATNVAAILLAVILFFALETDVGKLDRRGVAETFLKSSIAGAVGGAVAYTGSLLAPHAGSRLWDFGQLVIFGLLGFWAFFFVGRLLKMPETVYLDRVLAKFRRRG